MEENMQEKLEEIAMMIIANSGQARSDAFAALQEAKKGNFEEKNIQDAKKLIVASFKSMQDEQDSEISFYFGAEMQQENPDVEQKIKEIESVSKEEIINCANEIRINTIYFLSSK